MRKVVVDAVAAESFEYKRCLGYLWPLKLYQQVKGEKVNKKESQGDGTVGSFHRYQFSQFELGPICSTRAFFIFR